MSDPRVLMDDLVIGESPRWHDGRLWFCHWGPDRIVAVTEEGASEHPYPDDEVRAHSIDWLPDGRQLIVPKDQARLLRREPDGSLVDHADLSALPGGLNELVADGRGNVYVNGLAFDFLAFLEERKHDEDPTVPWRERPGFEPGFLALVTPDGAVRRVAEGIEFPNGMVVTPDGRTLVVSESFAGRLTAFDIAEDGSLTNRRGWADGLAPDGICLDAEGAIWTSTGGDVCVRVSEGGRILDRVEVAGSPFACMLGGRDGRTLFALTASWNPDDPFGARTGRVLALNAPAPHTGHP
ncbi:SMP-30/gluconolactonase/LRE family protein [Prauserella cavernicola]|uniref:SMP-30/gluconolactonase/LRE family protein n=1 Tax=Prauserella cavernicola TaxID=2800127 RepID=A0A934QU45_9PSEU|nr:SMP-30/gluconolactonase/LRE family protein [Prauserella cavernicola]MBK1786332.1 SMP-30/gluconolactonase/LRE family protein [Prauserella cavernicola]